MAARWGAPGTGQTYSVTWGSPARAVVMSVGGSGQRLGAEARSPQPLHQHGPLTTCPGSVACSSAYGVYGSPG